MPPVTSPPQPPASPSSGPRASPVAPYDALLLQSFGGPEQAADVLPFLENVTRGRGIPRERLESVAEHYDAFGGRSPINDQNRALLAAIGAELKERGVELPLYWGNRNWHPFLVDTLREAYRRGARRLVTVVTSAYSSYSGCRQYQDDMVAALAELAAEGIELSVDKVRGYFNHPGFVAANVDAVVAAFASLSPQAATSARIVFVTHSIPLSMQERSGPGGGAYSRQHLDVAQTVMDAVAGRIGRSPGWDLVYCSRSGSPHVPWLEPDVGDYLTEVAQVGVSGVVLVPIGFISDHMEVIYDLDTEAAGLADRLGLGFARSAAVGVHPAFVCALVDLVLERAAEARGASIEPAVTGALGPLPARCPVGCCAPAGRPA